MSGRGSTNPPASAQRAADVVVAAVTVPSYQSGLGHHIARSTTIGVPLVEVIVADTAVAASRASSSFTAMVSRLSAGDLVRLLDGRPVRQQVGDGDRRGGRPTDCRSG